MDWHYIDADKEQVGPVPEKAMEALARSRVVGVDTPVWRKGMSDWSTAGKTELAQLFVDGKSAEGEPFNSKGEAADEEPLVFQLLDEDGQTIFDTVLKDTPLLIGSSDECDITVDDDSLSPRHAFIYRYKGGVYLEDQGSASGSFVNSGRAGKMAALNSGDRLKFGDLEVTVRFRPQSAPAVEPSTVKMSVRDVSKTSGAERQGTVSLSGTATKDKDEEKCKKGMSFRRGWVIAGVALSLIAVSGVGTWLCLNNHNKALLRVLMPNSADAQYELGKQYLAGDGVSRDMDQGFDLLVKAARKGHSEAQYAVGVCYLKGRGVEKDQSTAISWIRKSAEKGCAKAQCLLGLIYFEGESVDKNTEQGFAWMSKSAEQGLEDAQCALGRRFLFGEDVDKDEVRGAELILKAAIQGNAEAMCLAGACYQMGLGVKIDQNKAIEWFKFSAKLGDAKAQYLLGCAYLNGEGVDKNLEEGVAWLNRASSQGFDDAQAELGLQYLGTREVAKDLAKAIPLLRDAAQKGNSQAQLNLGICYLYGCGVNEDSSEAYRWVRKSADQGNEKAIEKLKNLHL